MQCIVQSSECLGEVVCLSGEVWMREELWMSEEEGEGDGNESLTFLSTLGRQPLAVAPLGREECGALGEPESHS